MILQALAALYDRLDAGGNVPPYGFSNERISFAVVLGQDGGPVGVQSLQDTSGKRPRPSRRLVPQRVERSVNVKPDFLWGNTAYVLGVKRGPTGAPISARRGEHEAFRRFHRELLDGWSDDGLRAVLGFVDRWRPEWYVGLPHAVEMLDPNANVVFMLDGDGRRFLHDRDAARAAWKRHLTSAPVERGPCLVTGERSAPVERLHPPIRGVIGAPGTGAKLVSFNESAFESHGRRQGANAPVSKVAAFKYGTALNTLLAPRSRRRIRIGNTTVLFWAEAATGERVAEAAEAACLLLAEPPATDEGETAQVRGLFEKVAAGRPLREAKPECEDGTRFYVLGLEPNRARLAVRFWFETTIGEIGRRIGEHWRDLRLEPAPWRTPPAAWRLLLETAVQRKPEKIPPVLVGGLARAIFTGSAYPRSLLLAVISRLRAGGTPSGLPIAVAKACIRRAERLSHSSETEDCLVSLDPNSDNVAYLLGRLFAVFVYAEKAVAKRSATISDKWLGSASSAPSRAFPNLMLGFRRNVSKLAKGDPRRKGSGVRADRAAGDIVHLLPPPGDLPGFLTPDDQARFFVGYYHQERALYTKALTTDQTDEEENE